MIFAILRKPFQFGVEGEYTAGVSVSSERSDQLTLIPFMENLCNHGIEYADVTADAGYESEEKYSYFENISTECYIKPQNYERKKNRQSRCSQKSRLSFEFANGKN